MPSRCKRQWDFYNAKSETLYFYNAKRFLQSLTAIEASAEALPSLRRDAAMASPRVLSGVERDEIQAHFNMENMLSGSDRLFGLQKLKNKLVVFQPKYNRKHISHTIYIERKRERGWLIYNRLFLNSRTTKSFSDVQSPNGRSKW